MGSKSVVYTDPFLLPRFAIPGRCRVINWGGTPYMINAGLVPAFGFWVVAALLGVLLYATHTGSVSAEPLAVFVLWCVAVLNGAWVVLAAGTFDVLRDSTEGEWTRVRRCLIRRRSTVSSITPKLGPATAWRDAPRSLKPRTGFMVYIEIEDTLFPVCWANTSERARRAAEKLLPAGLADIEEVDTTVYCRALWIL